MINRIVIEQEHIGESLIRDKRKEAQKAIDDIWDRPSSWMKKPMTMGEQEIDDVIFWAEEVQKTAPLLVLVGDYRDIQIIQGIEESLVLKHPGGSKPIYIDQNMGRAEFDKAVDKMRQEEASLVLLERYEDVALKGFASLLEDGFSKRYPKGKGEEHIFIIENKKEDGYFSNFILLSLSACGIDIREMIRGAKNMAEDPIWDHQGVDFAIVSHLLARENLGNGRIKTFQKPLQGLATFMEEDGALGGNLLLREKLKEGEGIIFPQGLGTLNAEIIRKEENFLKGTSLTLTVELEGLTEKNLGEMLYFWQMSLGIISCLGRQ